MRQNKSTSAGARTHISFNPIPCQKDGGIICLSIYPPGQFINNEGFAVFVGGCGIGERATLEDAEAYLLWSAKQTCVDRIASAQAAIEHYQSQLSRLESEGLQGEKTEAN